MGSEMCIRDSNSEDCRPLLVAISLKSFPVNRFLKKRNEYQFDQHKLMCRVNLGWPSLSSTSKRQLVLKGAENKFPFFDVIYFFVALC